MSSAAAGMKLGVFVGFGAHTAPDVVAATGRLAEERDLHSLWVPEHVLLFPEYASRYPYSEDGRMPGGPIGLIDPFTALTWIAAHTDRLRLGTGICLVAQRNPIYTAKCVADLDFLSCGRVDFGVGIGWLREEFEALGVAFEDRAARTMDYLALMRRLWCDDVPAYEGTHHSLPECVFGPRPVQVPHPPIYFGGNADPALRRVAQAGQGWYGHDLLPAEAGDHIKRLRELVREGGRSEAEVRCVVSPFFAPITGDDLARYRDLGFDEVLLPLVGAEHDALERRADEIAALRGTLD